MNESTARRTRVTYIAAQLLLTVWLVGARSGGRTLSNLVQQLMVVGVLLGVGIWALPRFRSSHRPIWLLGLLFAVLLAVNVLAWEATPVLPE